MSSLQNFRSIHRAHQIHHGIANPAALGLLGHGVCALVYGSFLCNWRDVGTPLLVSAVCLAVATPTCTLASLMSLWIGDLLYCIIFAAAGTLWTILGLAYLPFLGFVAYYTSAPTNFLELENEIAFVMVYYGGVAFILSMLSLYRARVMSLILITGSAALLLLSASYFQHSPPTAKQTVAAGYLLVASGFASSYYIIACLCANIKFPLQLPLGFYDSCSAPVITSLSASSSRTAPIDEKFDVIETA